jgi:antitoxin (DNA-binding transcriptional repressor) of toxin-antitoxin stability system
MALLSLQAKVQLKVRNFSSKPRKSSAEPFCDATMYHMRKASVRDLRYAFKQIERLLHQGEEIQITKRRRVIARLVPESAESAAEVPDFLERLRSIYGDKVLAVSGAELVSEDRSRY